MCQILSLEISNKKNKAVFKERDKENRLFIDGNELEFVKYYKYLGTFVGEIPAKRMEMERLMLSCIEKNKTHEGALALGDKGVNAAVLRRMYIGFIRPLIDYAACTVIQIGKTSFKKIKKIKMKQ